MARGCCRPREEVRIRKRGRWPWGVSLTLASCVWSLFFTSVTSEMRALKARLVLVNCFHIWSDKVLKRFSASSHSRMELAHMFCECLMLSLLMVVTGGETFGR